jgi:hypothetical protein
MVNNSTNTNKTKESLNSNGQQFHQYKQNKRTFKQQWSIIPAISTKQKNFKQQWSIISAISTIQHKVYTVMVRNSTNINKTEEVKQ